MTLSEVAFLCWTILATGSDGRSAYTILNCRPAPEIKRDRVIADTGNYFRKDRARLGLAGQGGARLGTAGHGCF